MADDDDCPFCPYPLEDRESVTIATARGANTCNRFTKKRKLENTVPIIVVSPFLH